MGDTDKDPCRPCFLAHYLLIALHEHKVHNY